MFGMWDNPIMYNILNTNTIKVATANQAECTHTQLIQDSLVHAQLKL